MKDIWALTGGIACGKTTVAKMLQARGAIVIDADAIAREVVEPNSPGLHEIVAAFGPTILQDNGQLDRQALGERVFDDTNARERLNGILHPKIFVRSIEHMQQALQTDERPIFYDAALLVENESYKNFAGLLVVAASEDTQRRRLMARDELSSVDAQKRMDAQLPIGAKTAVADHVLWNDGSYTELETQVDNVLDILRHPQHPPSQQ